MPPTTPTIRILVPLDDLAEVLGLIASEVPLDEGATVKVQDRAHLGKHDLPVLGRRLSSPARRWVVVASLLLWSGIGVALTSMVSMSRGASLLLILCVATLGGALGAVLAAQRSQEPLLDLGEPDRVRVVRIRHLRRHWEAVQCLRAAGLAEIDRRDGSILLAHLPHGARPHTHSVQQSGDQPRVL